MSSMSSMMSIGRVDDAVVVVVIVVVVIVVAVAIAMVGSPSLLTTCRDRCRVIVDFDVASSSIHHRWFRLLTSITQLSAVLATWPPKYVGICRLTRHVVVVFVSSWPRRCYAVRSTVASCSLSSCTAFRSVNVTPIDSRDASPVDNTQRTRTHAEGKQHTSAEH